MLAVNHVQKTLLFSTGHTATTVSCHGVRDKLSRIVPLHSHLSKVIQFGFGGPKLKALHYLTLRVISCDVSVIEEQVCISVLTFFLPPEWETELHH